jgi:hypothetical protein
MIPFGLFKIMVIGVSLALSIGLLFTKIASVVSAFVPSSIVFPLTLTLPASISFSASLREHIPALAIIFWTLSGSMEFIYMLDNDEIRFVKGNFVFLACTRS